MYILYVLNIILRVQIDFGIGLSFEQIFSMSNVLFVKKKLKMLVKYVFFVPIPMSLFKF